MSGSAQLVNRLRRWCGLRGLVAVIAVVCVAVTLEYVRGRRVDESANAVPRLSLDRSKQWPELRVTALDDARVVLSTLWSANRLFYHLEVDRYPSDLRGADRSFVKCGFALALHDGNGIPLLNISIDRSRIARVGHAWWSAGHLESTGDVPLTRDLYDRLVSWNIVWLLAGRPPVVVSSISNVGLPSKDPIRLAGSARVPKLLRYVEPVYSQEAESARLRGTVIVELVIGSDGHVASGRVVRSVPLLDRAVLDAVQQWRYVPTLSDGVPIPVKLSVTISLPTKQSSRAPAE